MKKKFVFRTLKGGLSNVVFGDDTMTDEEKEQALKAVREEARKEVDKAIKDDDNVEKLFKAGLTRKEVKKAIEDIATDIAKSLVEKFEIDDEGEKKTISAIVKELQDQHDAVAKVVKNLNDKGAGAVKEGTFVAFVLKNIEDNPEVKVGDAIHGKSGIAADKNYSAHMVIKAAALMTTANVIPNVAGGFSPLFGNYIDEEIGHIPKPDNIILPLITVKNQPGTENIWYSDRINEEGDAQFIAEGALKPLADAEWKTSKAAVKEVAVRWKFTKRLMNHAPSVVADFLEHAYELVSSEIDDQLLAGDGTGNNLLGLAAVAAAFVVPPALAAFYTDANIYDVIMAMATRIRLSNFKGQITAVINTVWKAKMLGYKDGEGRYLVPDFVAPDGTKVSDVNVVFSNKIGADNILIGELKNFVLVMAEGIEYDEGYENDDFSKNLVSRKLEAFMGTYIKASNAGSILYDEISSVLTDIAAA